MAVKRSLPMRMVDKLLKCPYVLIAPAVLIVAVMTIYPMIYGLVVSFTNWDIVSGEMDFVGIDNYQYLFTNDEFWLVLRNTVVYTVCVVFFTIVLSLGIGIFLNKKKPVYSFVQTIVFTPYILSMVAIAVLFSWLFDVNVGFFNYVLTALGFEPLMWLRSESTSLMSLIIVSVWKDLGYSSLMIIAGLQSIPKDVYESAKLDRAGSFTIFRKITLPLLSPTIFFLLITKTIDSFRAFDIAYNMTQGGPRSSSKLLVLFIYQEGYQNFRMGTAMAAAIVLLVLVTIISYLNFAVIEKKVHYQ